MDEVTCYAVCGRGLEDALEAELKQLGARDLQIGRGGITFAGDRRLVYAANLWLRSAIRVQEELMRISEYTRQGIDSLLTPLQREEFREIEKHFFRKPGRGQRGFGEGRRRYRRGWRTPEGGQEQ